MHPRPDAKWQRLEPLAAALSPSFRIICPDLAGRGRSLAGEAADYNLLQYNMDVVVLAARTLGDQFDFVGTSSAA